MKRIGIILLAALLLSGCGAGGQSADDPGTADGYRQIDQETAKQMMEQDDGHIVVDVRRFDEYRSGHIPGAICIPNESIETELPKELPNPDQVILVYCRSGNRSKQAAEKLAAMGCSRVCEFGGINDWTGEVAAGQTLVVTLESNPTTGYSWELEQEREFFAVRSFYTAAPQKMPVSGSGGWQSFVLTPMQAGTAELSFTCSRPWEPNETDPHFTCTVEISEDLSVTVTGGVEEAAEQGYPPTVRIYG